MLLRVVYGLAACSAAVVLCDKLHAFTGPHIGRLLCIRHRLRRIEMQRIKATSAIL